MRETARTADPITMLAGPDRVAPVAQPSAGMVVVSYEDLIG